MTHDYDSLFTEWYSALVEVAVSYADIENGVYYKRAVERATGLAKLTQRYPEFVKVMAVPTWRDTTSRKAQRKLTGRVFSAETIVADVERAYDRLEAFCESNTWLDGAAASAPGREKRFLQNAAQRYRALDKLRAGLAWDAHEAYAIQMRATIEPEYIGALLREAPTFSPAANSQQALAIMMLHDANIPLSYSTALLMPKTLSETGARQVIELYAAGVSPEFAGATL